MFIRGKFLPVVRLLSIAFLRHATTNCLVIILYEPPGNLIAQLLPDVHTHEPFGNGRLRFGSLTRFTPFCYPNEIHKQVILVC